MTGPEISGMPDAGDLKNFFTASLVTSVAFAAFYGEFSDVSAYVFFIPAAAAVIFTRELGVRAAVNVLDGYVDLEVSSEGATTTLFGAIMSVVSGLPVLLLFPLYSSPSRVKYENWAKAVDVVWAHYKFWIAASGIAMLFAGYFVSLGLEASRLAQMFALFTFFQMMPFDYSGIPTGPLDGAEIIRWSGFYWLFFTGLSLLGMALTI